MNPFGSKLTRSTVGVALSSALFFALPIKMDAQHPIGYSPALASPQHDSADPYNNNTDNARHEQNQDKQYNGQ
jgi:hypothetical protein